MCSHEKVVSSDRIWASLITKDSYLPGLLTLAFSLRRVGSRYPLVALHTGTLTGETVRAISARDIPMQRVPRLFPGKLSSPVHDGAANGTDDGPVDGDGGAKKNGVVTNGGDSTNGDNGGSSWYEHDPRFRDCFTKLAVFSLTAYSRVVLLDADMLVRRNMDELFDLPLDRENRLFAATHACVCNPRHFRHYPEGWTPPHCAFTQQGRSDPAGAQASGGSPYDGMGQLNGGLLVLAPSDETYRVILDALQRDDTTSRTPISDNANTTNTHPSQLSLPFADQSLLGELFAGRWATLPYVYNALRPMRARGVHGGSGALWRDTEVRNVHYILTPKPWETATTAPVRTRKLKGVADRDLSRGRNRGGEGNDDDDETDSDEVLDRWWKEVDLERREWEAKNGLIMDS
ncbi:glycosyltransferase family 8 protein [Corynascus similis CBS 632.67]